ncbi:hypothetical protein EPH95_06680 [Salicibibacter halophilus]|uniref:Ribosomal protein L7/L12 C-terminal domain-containing protein n=1 Tax=Salicibibacter halophilus TaxID=2502791 RepID=A0A514LGC7_9BACI|nr:hypothetical protein [Salicibibacter halophilus]QDI90902.1 hypothetical protein EPH95_06680 [Salicibibacter halophilus]
MPWSDISLLTFILILMVWCFRLMRKNSTLKRENDRLLKVTGAYVDMESEAKKILRTSTEVKTVKTLRERYDLSMIDAKKIVDSVK